MAVDRVRASLEYRLAVTAAMVVSRDVHGENRDYVLVTHVMSQV